MAAHPSPPVRTRAPPLLPLYAQVEVNGMGQLQLIRTPTPADLERVMKADQEERIAAAKVRRGGQQECLHLCAFGL